MIAARILAHLRVNIIAYVALFAALGGTSYAAVRLKPGSVTSAALAKRAVTHSKLGLSSVTSANVARHSLTGSDFKPGALTAGGTSKGGRDGGRGEPGSKGDPGAQGPTGVPGGAAVVGRPRSSGAVSAPHGANTNIPLSNAGWTQARGELDLITGSLSMHIPSACTGSFGNAVVVSVDGNATTVGLGPTLPASGTATVPLVVGTLTEPDSATAHRISASFANSCTKDGEDYTVSAVKLDVIGVP
jgi:hypothetical protein